MTSLVVNMLLKWMYEDDTYDIERILWLDRQIAYVINIKENRCPFVRERKEIEIAIEDNRIEILNHDPYGRVVTENEISEKERQKRDEAWNTISEFVEIEPEIFDSKARRAIIKQASKKHGLAEQTILNYLKRYWRRGKTPNSLLPDYYLCGGKGKEKSAGKAKRGRPRKIDMGDEGINVDEEMKRIFRVAIQRFYYTSAKNSLTTTYELMRKEFFSEDFKIQDGIKIPIIKSQAKVPTFGQFRYWFEKERNIRREVSTRKSPKKYEQQNRQILGSSTYEAIGPGSIYQIDATVGDIYLVSRYNRNWIIGRPIIYAVIDVFSRMVVGVYVGLEGPSWIGSMMALANATTDKVKFCREYSIDIEEGTWPVHYLPETILADRGEIEGKNIENLISTLHVKVQNTPPYRADWKGIVEQYFRTINLKVKPFLPGMIDANVRERGDRDYRLDAKLDIYEFTQIIIRCALYHNNGHYLKNYDREEMMIADDIKCIPIKLWNWGIKNRVGRLRKVPEDIIKLNLMPSDIATVTARGIRFKGMYYGSSITIKEKWFEKSRNKGVWKISVCYDPRNMDYIYLKDENGLSFEKCFLLSHQDRYRGKTLDEITHLLLAEEIERRKSVDKELQSKVDLMAYIEDIVNRATNKTNDKKALGESNSRHLQSIRANRAIEKTINRQKEVFELDKQDVERADIVSFYEAPEHDEDKLDDLSVLRKKQIEGLNKASKKHS